MMIHVIPHNNVNGHDGNGNGNGNGNDGKQLRDAAKQGNVDSLLHALNNGVDVNTVFGKRWTSLHYAAFRGHAKCVQFLLMAKGTIDAKDDYCRIPLHWACMAGYLDCTLVLLKGNGVDYAVDTLDHSGRTPLALAVKFNKDECVKALLDKGALLGKIPQERQIDIPPWVYRYRLQLASCQCARRALSRFVQRHHPESKDLIPTLSNMVWATRGNVAWQCVQQQQQLNPSPQ